MDIRGSRSIVSLVFKIVSFKENKSLNCFAQMHLGLAEQLQFLLRVPGKMKIARSCYGRIQTARSVGWTETTSSRSAFALPAAKVFLLL